MAKKVLVGILLLGALFIFGLATFYIENWQYYLGKGYRLRVRFPAVQTLDKGDIVRMAGVPVGTVEDLKIDTSAAENPVHAVLWIQRDVKVRASDIAAIRVTSVFGGSYVAIERGDPNAPVLGDGDEIVRTQVTPSITEIIEQAKDTLAEAQRAIQDVRAVTADLAEGKGTIGRLIKSDELYQKLDSTADNLKLAGERIEKGEGLLGRLIMDDKIAQNFDSISENLRAIAQDLEEGKGTLGKLLKEEDLYDKLKASIDTISEAARMFKEGEGLLPKLLSDAEMAEDLRKSLANIRDFTDKASKGDSTISRLLTSDEAYNELMESLRNVREFSESLSKGEGTLAKLVREDTVYNQIGAILDTLQGLLDTYREQSPIISFAGAIFGAF